MIGAGGGAERTGTRWRKRRREVKRGAVARLAKSRALRETVGCSSENALHTLQNRRVPTRNSARSPVAPFQTSGRTHSRRIHPRSPEPPRSRLIKTFTTNQ